MGGQQQLDDQAPEPRPNGSGEVRRLQSRVRVIVALAFVAGLAIDRIGPVISRDWAQYSEWSLGLILASILVLLGSESLAVVFGRIIGGGR